MTRLMLTKGPAGSGRSRQEVANSGVTSPPRHHEAKSFLDGLFSALVWLSSTSGRLRGSYARSGHGTAPRGATRAPLPRQEGLAIAEIARRLGRAEATIKAYLYDPTGERHARSRRATAESVAAAGRPPRHGTARATPTRIANAAIPARLHRNGRGNGFAKRCAPGERATARRRLPTTGRALTHAGAAATPSNDYRPENGPRRPLSSICTGAGRRPSPTPSTALERLASLPMKCGRARCGVGSADVTALLRLRQSSRRDSALPRRNGKSRVRGCNGDKPDTCLESANGLAEAGHPAPRAPRPWRSLAETWLIPGSARARVPRKAGVLHAGGLAVGVGKTRSA